MFMLEKIKKLIDEIHLIKEDGIYFDIKEFFTDDERIKKIKFQDTHDTKYKVDIEMDNYSEGKVFEIFMEFLVCEQYRKCNFYYKQEFEHKTKYTLVSVRENMEGFCCELIFR